MKKVLLSFAAITTFSMVGMLFFNQGNLYSESSGSPVATTCAQGGCHSDGGPAQINPDVFLTIKDSTGAVANAYNAGQKYIVTVGKHNTSDKVGFALSANMGILAKNSGDGKVQKKGTYLTHTFSGTAFTGGEASWSGTWTAPASGTATLTLFINQTNENNSTSGDLIYTLTETLHSSGNTGLNKLSSDIRFKTFPNPATDQLNILFDVKYPSPIVITLTSIDGKQTHELFNGEEAKGTVDKSFDISNLSKGIYLLNIQTTEGSATQKVIVN